MSSLPSVSIERSGAPETSQPVSVFALMMRTLQLSRAMAERKLADEVLEQGIQNALALLDDVHQR